MGFLGLPSERWLGSAQPPGEVIFRMEDRDGLILGVVKVGEDWCYARFDHYRGKWSFRMSKQARRRVEAAWTAEVQRTYHDRLEQIPGS